VNVYEFLQIPASMFPGQEILADGETRLTYGVLLERVNRLAAALRAAGFAPGERAACLDVNSHRSLEAYLATVALGGAFVPLNFRARHDELAYMIEAAQATTLFFGERYRAVLPPGEGPGLLKRWVALGEHRAEAGGSAAGSKAPLSHEALIASGADFAPAPVEEEQTAILMFTSGTTSRPKGVHLTHGDFTLYVTNSVELADGGDRGVMLMAMPLYHIAGATSILTCLFSGRRLALLPQFDAGQWLEMVERERITHSFLVPTMMKKVLDHPDFSRRDLSTLRNLAYGGAPMPVPVIREAIRRFPASTGFVNAFGQTETTSTLTVLGPEDHRLSGSTEEIVTRTRRLASVGRPLPDVEIRIAGSVGEALAAGQVGEIWVRTGRLMKGYEGLGATTMREGGWHATGDMGWLDQEGYLFIAGRKDDMIIRGGENISPAEIESVLHAHPAVEEAAVIGVPDLEWGQRVAAAVVLRPGARAGAEELREFVHQRLASYKKPERIMFLPELPKTATGKVIKRELPSLFLEGAGAAR
jgi:acyl-CoA synthetase (AMP-forming)/AMP-acid ligase II